MNTRTARRRTRRSVSALRWLAALMAAALVLVACGGQEEAVPDEPAQPAPSNGEAPPADDDDDEDRVLRMAWSSRLLSFDPPNEAAVHGLALVHNLYEGLVAYDFDDGAVVPALASEWSISDDGLTYTFTIDDRAVFSSGNQVTAEDARWSLQRIVDWPEAVQGFQVRPFLQDATIEAVDDRTLEITLSQPAAALLFALAGHASSIIDSQVALANEVDGDLGQAYLAENVAGSGPFVLDEYSPDNFYTLSRNENYWREVSTNISAVQMQFIDESSQQESLLRSGDVDVIFDALPDTIALLENDGFVAGGGADVFTYYVSVNQLVAPFDDIRVRQALRYAVDYDGIIDELLAGRAVKAGSVLADGLLGADPSYAQRFDYDPDRARELLAEAGLADGFSTEMYLIGGTIRGLGLPNELVATKIQNDLAAVGIDIELQIQDVSALFPLYRAGELPLTFWFFGPTYPDSDAIMSPHGDWDTQATTRVGFNNPTVTELIQGARVELDVDRRAQMYREAAEIVNEESPYLFLFRPENTPVTSPDVELFYTPIWQFELGRTVMR